MQGWVFFIFVRSNWRRKLGARKLDMSKAFVRVHRKRRWGPMVALLVAQRRRNCPKMMGSANNNADAVPSCPREERLDINELALTLAAVGTMYSCFHSC